VARIVKKVSLVSDLLDRPASLRPPSWRWLALLDYLVSEDKDLQILMADKALYDAAIFMKSRRFSKSKSISAGARHAQVAYWLFTDNKPYGRKWALEAFLLTKATPAQIAKNFLDITEQDIWYYQKLFFDVAALLDKPIDIVTGILHAARADANECNEYDLLWKTYAYRFGYEAFQNYLQIGLLDPDPMYLKWLHEFRDTRLLERSCQLTQNAHTSFKEMSLDLIKNAQGMLKASGRGALPSLDGEEEAIDMEADVNGSYHKFVATLSEAIQLAIIPKSEQLPAIELLPVMN
jgi:hypothetical protein